MYVFYITTLYEPSHEKTNNLGFRPGPTQTSLSSHRKKAISLKLWIKAEEELCYPVGETGASWSVGQVGPRAISLN